jgi:hypothetical protein
MSIANIDKLQEKVKNNFLEHLESAKNSKLFQHHSDKFFGNLDMGESFKQLKSLFPDKPAISFDTPQIEMGNIGVEFDTDSLEAFQKIKNSKSQIDSPTKRNNYKL